MPVEVDFNNAVRIIRVALATQRTARTVLRLVATDQLWEAAVVGLDPFSCLFHAFACRTTIAMGEGVIDKFVGCIGLLVPFLMRLIPVEVIVLYIGGNTFVFQPLVVLFAAVAGIGCDIGRLLLKGFYMLLQMRDQCFGIGLIGMQAVGGNKLVVGADLYVIAWL